MEALAEFACVCGRRSRFPSSRPSILARELPLCTCGTPLETPCAYVDLERRHAIRVEPASSFTSWPTLEKTCLAGLTRTLVHASPHLSSIAHELRFRLAFSLEELREKLVLWSHAMDDAVVECVKVRAFADQPDLASPDTRLIVDRVADDDTLICHVSTSIIELPGSWVRTAHADRDRLSDRFPELFTGAYVNARRYFTP